MHDIWDFLCAVWEDWITRMSGIASVILGAIAASSSGPLPNWSFWAAAAACLLVTSFRVWQVERGKHPKRARMALSFDQSMHRKDTGFVVWKTFLINKTLEIPLEDPRVRIMEVVPVGHDDRVVADEVKGMFLEPTHHQGGSAVGVITVDQPFDVLSAYDSENYVRVSHATISPATSKVNRDMGRLPKKDFSIRLRAEARNADPCEQTLLIRWVNGKILVEPVTSASPLASCKTDASLPSP